MSVLKSAVQVPGDRVRQRRLEVFAIVFLTGVVMPALAVMTVGGYGFVVWVYQMIVGPPGPPAG